jgi:hypothetical protein
MAAEIRRALATCDAGDHYIYPEQLVSASDFCVPETEERQPNIFWHVRYEG